MKPAPFDYVAPETIEAACALLDEAGGGAAILAGGQTLMPLLALRMNQPFVLVDISRIPALRGISRSESGTRVGAMTRQYEALASQTLGADLPVLTRALAHVGHHQTRNRGTIGGSIALGEPAAEMPATAVALGASIEIHSAGGSRRVPAEAFYVGPYMTVLEPGELVTAIHYPDWPKNHLVLFRELAQRPGDFALVGIVGALAVAGGRIAKAGIAWFGMGPTPIKARQAEAALAGQPIAGLDAAAIAELAIADTAPFDDHHASAEYRRTVGKRLFASALRGLLEQREAA
jgi:carbon-monoxide dehydrogenase medium subunit